MRPRKGKTINISAVTGATEHTSWFFWDIIFIFFALAYAMLAYEGISDISGQGVVLDSDLQTYAQGMAGEKFPGLFAADPVLKDISAANSIPNLQRIAGNFFLDGNNFGLALLKAGACAIFIFYVGWYILGRYLFKRPVLAALLSLCMGITIWIGWGTFWGITHSDPIPRVFFAAFMPFMLILAIAGAAKPYLRPAAMFCAGLAMWLHGVSALNCGAMFFTAFLFLKPAGKSWLWHCGNLFCCLICFFAPVLYFLWPSLGQGSHFSPEEMDFFKNYFALRWREDYGRFGQRVLDFLNPAGAPAIFIIAGLVSWIAIRKKCHGRLKTFWKMCPGFALALITVAFFCWAETKYVPEFGRLPMGHELVRGLRFFIPIAWILIGGFFLCFVKPILWRVTLGVVVAGLLIFTTDRQYAAAQYAVYQHTGIKLPLVHDAEEYRARALKTEALMKKVAETVPKGEAVYSDEEIMATRYKALRPLAHTFKDGYVFFYNKDLQRSRQWLDAERIIRAAPRGYIRVWLRSGAPWLLTRKIEDMPVLERYGDIVLNDDGWILVRKKQNAGKQK